MASVIRLISPKTIEQLRKDLETAAVVALKRLDKVVTGKTAQSIRTEVNEGAGELSIDLFGGGGMKFIVEGKKPNTKLPVKKVGQKFELVQELKDWKAIRNVKGSDFLLARAIAKNPREPVDVAGATLEVYEELFGAKNNQQILNFTVSEIREEIKKIK